MWQIGHQRTLTFELQNPLGLVLKKEQLKWVDQRTYESTKHKLGENPAKIFSSLTDNRKTNQI